MSQGARRVPENSRSPRHRSSEPFYPLARLGAARAYVLQGDKVHARTAYQDFFAQWKDADPDIPVLKSAQAEYATLQ